VTQHSLPNGELCHDTSDSESVPKKSVSPDGAEGHRGTSTNDNLLIGHKAINHDRTMVLSWATENSLDLEARASSMVLSCQWASKKKSRCNFKAGGAQQWEP
jgi:hypothetical protein